MLRRLLAGVDYCSVAELRRERAVITRWDKVNWLTVHEISNMWAPELGMPASVVERELRIALYKLEVDYALNEPLDVNPDTVDLPPPETLVSREFIERFHDKEAWKLPDFWFKDLPFSPSFPGRPSVMAAIIQELRERALREEMAATLAAQGRVLSDWAKARFPAKQTPTPKAVENGIRLVFNTLKKDQ